MSNKIQKSSLLSLLFAWMLAFALVLVPSVARADQEAEELPIAVITYDESGQPIITAHIEAAYITKYGNVMIDAPRDMLKETFAFGDVVTVSFLNQSLDLPFCSNYSDVDSGMASLLARENDDYGSLAINMGDFATTYGIATKTINEDGSATWTCPEGVEEPIELIITLKEAGGYYDEYIMHQLSYTDERSDYEQLSDEQFANFREVTTTGIASGVLYRSASPVDNERGRSRYADAAIERVGVTAIVDLADTEAELVAFEGYDETYYATAQHVALSMSMDLTSDENKQKLAEGLRFMAQNPGVYAIHCLEGKDRTGLVVAIIECLMGASKDEVVVDYMESYYNYYGVTPEDERYDAIANSNIIKTLQHIFDVESLDEVDLAAEAEEYLLATGVTQDEIAALKANLNPKRTVTVSFNMGGHGCAPADQEVTVGECAVRPANPVAVGFVFAGWYTDEARMQAFDFATPIEQDTTLYAKWIVKTCPHPVVIAPLPVRPVVIMGCGALPFGGAWLNPWYLARGSRVGLRL